MKIHKFASTAIIVIASLAILSIVAILSTLAGIGLYVLNNLQN